MKTAHFYILTAIASILFSSAPCLAAGNSTTVRVSATVLPFVSLAASQRVASYQVRSEDLRRGYVDLPDSLMVNFSTNVNGGVPVSIESAGAGSVLVSESGKGSYVANLFTLNTSGRGAGEKISQGLDTRIMLPADAREGTYPLTIAMTPVI